MVSRNIAITMIFILLGLIVSMQFKSINYKQKLLEPKIAQANKLKEELFSEKDNNKELMQQCIKLERENLENEKQRSNINQTTKVLSESLETFRKVAGLTDVVGSGVIIEVDHRDGVMVKEKDLLTLVNVLNMAGAEAVAINDERIISRSEIRNVAENTFIVINGKRMTVPFEVKAIVDAKKLEELIGVYSETNQLLKIKASEDIFIPKYMNSVEKLISNVEVIEDEVE